MTDSSPTVAEAVQDGQRDSSGWSASLYNKTASFVYSPSYASPILDLLAARPGERIMDIGCGSGELTKDLQLVVEQKDGGVIVGTDFSESMIEKALQNGVKYAFVADAQDLVLPEGNPVLQVKFDAVFSNAALHWCKRDPLGVLVSAGKVLKPGGRIVAEMGGFMNVVGLRGMLHEVIRSTGRDPEALDPWFFPSPEDYEKLLITAGFEPTHISLTPRITPLATGLYEWLHLFARSSFLRDFSDEEADRIMRKVEDGMRRDCQDASGKWSLMYTRLRFSATLKPLTGP
ncbi:hypothetical protein HYPSUDRAFT_42244 [Hypholoma sublateritium FD-334 SS-4]|uniref:Methyltransferase type 11 domain-containing protein n=1 Tax=Hypholoma sublateritium (strain FD-334 SS-4) TaxID=945553 RepID=A0A0D2L312_HYPSF|nr:hypothetical protein HYPSUDRAFT_42244 [Hypholoma sublateritium FD-334 SS-4]